MDPIFQLITFPIHITSTTNVPRRMTNFRVDFFLPVIRRVATVVLLTWAPEYEGTVSFRRYRPVFLLEKSSECLKSRNPRAESEKKYLSYKSLVRSFARSPPHYSRSREIDNRLRVNGAARRGAAVY